LPYQLYYLDKLKKLNLGKNMISKLDYLIEIKKLKSLNDLIIEDNPVFSLKDASEILRTLPMRYIPRLTSESVSLRLVNGIMDEVLPDITESSQKVQVRSSSNNSKNPSNKSSNNSIPKVHDSNSQICNTVSSFYPKNKPIEDTNELSESERIKNDIIKEWKVDNKILDDRKKKVVSGLAEIEAGDKLLIYGNALDILDNCNYYENITSIYFEYINILQIADVIEKLKNFRGLVNLKFSNNNIKSLTQLARLKELKLENITIDNNDILKVDLLKDFLIYLQPGLKYINNDEVSENDIIRSSKHTKNFNKCLTEYNLETNGLNKVEAKIPIIDQSINELREKYLKFVKENLHIVLDELLNEK
jgi:hypothetical protein